MNVMIIKFSSILAQNSENCYIFINYIFHAYFKFLWASDPIIPSVFLSYLGTMFVLFPSCDLTFIHIFEIIRILCFETDI